MKIHLLYNVIKNIIPILRFNFHYLPWRQAIKLPVFLKDPQLRVLRGTVSIESDKIYPGMIRLGFPSTCMIPSKGFHWLNRGGVVFKGAFRVGNDSVMETCSKACLIIGDNVSFNGGFRITCSQYISIGNDCLGSWNISIYDTDFHRMTSVETNMKISHCSSDIVIGNNCWIGFGATILKGSMLGDRCILGAKSLLNKNYQKDSNAILAGFPAKPVKYGYYLNIRDCEPEWYY